MSAKQKTASIAARSVLAVLLCLFPRPALLAAAGEGVDPRMAALLPPDAAMIVGVDVDRLKETGVYAYLLAKQSGEARARLEEFVTRTGFDPRHDVSRFLAGVVDDGPDSTSDDQRRSRFVAVAKGRFDPQRLESQFLEHGAKASDYHGVRVFEFERQDNGGRSWRSSQPLGLAFLDSETVVLGVPELLPAAIDRRLAGGPSLLDRSDFLARAQTLGLSHQLWVLSERSAALIEQNTPRELPPRQAVMVGILSSLQSSTLALDLSRGLNFEAVGSFQSAADAKNLADAARGILAFARLSAESDNRPVLPLFENVAISEQNERLTVSLEIGQAALEKLIESFESDRGVGVAQSLTGLAVVPLPALP